MIWYNFSTNFHCFVGILKKWQLIFYGTSTNPIKLRSDQHNNPVYAHSPHASSSADYPYSVDAPLLPRGHLGYNHFFPSSGFQSYQGPYLGAASNVQASVATLDGSSVHILTNRLPGGISPASAVDSSVVATLPIPSSSSSQGDVGSLDPTKRILRNCDPQCDSQGCYEEGPTQCIACKNFRLDK